MPFRECALRGCVSAHGRVPLLGGMSAVALIASVQASVAAALARGVSIDAIESRLAVCCSEMNMLTAGTKRNLLVGAAAEASPVPRRRPGAGEPRLSPVAMDNAPSAVTAGTAPQKQGSPGRRQPLPPSRRGIPPSQERASLRTQRALLRLRPSQSSPRSQRQRALAPPRPHPSCPYPPLSGKHRQPRAH